MFAINQVTQNIIKYDPLICKSCLLLCWDSDDENWVNPFAKQAAQSPLLNYGNQTEITYSEL